MRNLQLIAVDGHVTYDCIVQAKRGVRHIRLKNLSAQVAGRFTRYDQECMHLERLRPGRFSPVAKGDLRHCYTTKTKPLSELCAAIVAAQEFGHCPYCTLATPRETFDHYLPQEHFAEFAAYQNNLLPCCAGCNHRKGSRWRAKGQRIFLNLYFDLLPTTSFLTARIEDRDGDPVARFRLRTGGRFYGGNQRLIRSHFRELNLLNRYEALAKDLVPEELALVKSLIGKLGPTGRAMAFRDRALELSRQNSPNYWQVALIRGMANNRRFMRGWR